MGIIHFEKEIPTAIAPSRMLKAFIIDSHNLLPKVIPQAFQSIDVLEGDGTGVGTVKLWNFADGGDFKQWKQRIDELDEDNFTCKYTTYEGDGVWENVEKTVCKLKIEGYGNGGSIYKFAAEVHVKGDQAIMEEFINNSEEQERGLYKLVEAHLLANPDLYT